MDNQQTYMKYQLTKLFAVAGLLAASVFVSQAQPYYVAGGFNSWDASGDASSLLMTAGPNAGEYTATITNQTAGAYDSIKVATLNFASSWPSGNMMILYDTNGTATIHFWPGTSQDGWLPIANRVGYDDPDNDPGWSIAGSFNGWGTAANLIGIGNGVYTNTIVDTNGPGTGFYKFQSPQNSWSDINFGSPDFANGDGNGSYVTTNNPQNVPVVLDLPNGRFYVLAPIPPPTNYVTFQLDMTYEVEAGNFTNTDLNTNDVNYGLPVNSVAVGGVNGDWGTDNTLTNYTILNPGDLNPGLKTNLYIGGFSIQQFLPITIDWKFRVNNLDGGYENPLSTSDGNRVTILTNQNTVLPVIFYDDIGAGDLVLTDTVVTFSIYVTNGTPALSTNGLYFTKGSDTIWINGAWLNWNNDTWGYDALPANQQMMEVGDSDVYTNSLVVPRGQSVAVTYKYSFDGADNENGSNTNHIRYIRTYGTNYVFPQDVWSWTIQPLAYPNPGITSTNIVEPSFGYLAAGAPSGGNIPITWLGRPGVVLENSSSLTSGIWNTNTATDGTQSINWPNSGDQFFRLLKYSTY